MKLQVGENMASDSKEEWRYLLKDGEVWFEVTILWPNQYSTADPRVLITGPVHVSEKRD